MDSTKNLEHTNPREKANILAVLFWTWTLKIFAQGTKKILGPEDLYSPTKPDVSEILGDRLETKWNKELQKAKQKKRRPSLLRAIFLTFLPEYFVLGIIHVFSEMIFKLLLPLLLGLLLDYFRAKINATETTTTREQAFSYAGGICIINAISVITVNQTIFEAFHTGGKIRIAVCSLVYRKALRLSKTALGETAPGKIVNLVASDVNRFEFISVYIHHMWTAPASSLIIAGILYSRTGYAGLIGMLAVFTVVPIQVYAGKLSSIFRLQTALKMDERVRLMDEIISGVQVIKMYAWEKPFCALVELARKLELKVVRKSSYLRGLYMMFNLFTTRAALFATLITLLLTEQKITAANVFVFQAYFDMLSHTMSRMFVRGFAEIAECNVAVRRLQNFLMFEDFEKGNVTNVLKASKLCDIDKHINGNGKTKDSNLILAKTDILNQSTFIKKGNIKPTNFSDDLDDSWGIKFDHVTAKWDLSAPEPTLDDIDLKVQKGKLYVVIGMVGSGKTSLLNTILGEVSLVQGNVKVKGGISYAGQDCWVFGGTVRQNILFGEAFDRYRYQKVVKVCALQKDFKQFPQGDQTIVGERGSSLSGGQKARINLARAVYRQADIYLLDDPLSAVDAHVGKHLFEECLQRYLYGKTRILATHQLQYIKDADKIVLLDQGKPTIFDNYQNLFRDHPEYSHLIAEESSGEASDGTVIEKFNKVKRQVSTISSRSHATDASGCETDDEEEIQRKQQLIEMMEGTSKGVVKGNINLKYFNAGGSVMHTCITLLLFILTQVIVSFNDYFVTYLIKGQESNDYWKNSSNAVNNNTKLPIGIIQKNKIWSNENYEYVYATVVCLIFIVGLTRSFAFYTLCLKCSQRLHDKVFEALIHAPMRFFDTNPSGRILNRFSKDLGAIDELLPRAIFDAAQIILTMVGAIIVTCMINYWFLIPVFAIGIIFSFIRKAYLKTSKNIKRLEGMTRSPVFTHLNATLNGLSTIRAYNAEAILKKEFDKYQDIHTSSWYMFIATSSAFGFSIDLFCFAFTTLVTFSFVFFSEYFNGGAVGLAITQVMAMQGMVQWGMRQAAEVSNQMMSVERVLEYSVLPREKNLRDQGEVKKKKPKQIEKKTFVEVPKNWPSKGKIEFQRVFMRYADDEAPILKDLNMTIQPTEKVGIVGRTGAGKSSLIAALFRLAKIEGPIVIDNIDTGTVALEDLRKKISIIPQDPVLFSGTLRRNLDPFNEFSDADLWKVLEDVELKDAVAATGNGLDNRVFDRGSNYSVGQRQLVCLARAILKNNRILMLDEATANVDPQTDALIQRTIRTKFAPCTVLTVAHRLNTIMDSDKVLVMDKGRPVEFDHPYNLLQKPQGQFTLLVKETGPAMSDQLFKVARDSYQISNSKL